MRIQLVHAYEDITSLENLLLAWREFSRDKKQKRDVQLFSLQLMENILNLRAELVAKTYVHSPYKAFAITDPKPRSIHKALVRDRLLHHALCRKLYPFFDRTFISDSYSCRIMKGVHLALDQFRTFGRKVSLNHTRTCWVLKCDVRKFFASIDHFILIDILKKYIADPDVVWLIERVVDGFQSTAPGKGLPLGNLTSQLLVNIYMNEFDQFVKHRLKVKYYIRYADDFVIFHEQKKVLERQLRDMSDFLEHELKLSLHPGKVSIKTLASGVDFLGWVHFPHHRVLRSVTKRRMFKRLAAADSLATVRSYLGLLSHGNTYYLCEKVAQYERNMLK
ncbi:MAG: reverse transcriptase/maturase family protein [Patescibacteria group bacterium]